MMKQFRKMKDKINVIDLKRLSLVYEEADRIKNEPVLEKAVVDFTPDDTTNN